MPPARDVLASSLVASYEVASGSTVMVFKGIAPPKQVSSLLEEFKTFAFKGNVVDLAIGVIIGAAFGKIVDSLVKSIIMPLIGVIMPGQRRYQDWVWSIRGQEVAYGHFLAEVVNFVIVAAALFIFVVKFLGWLMRTKKEDQAAPPPPPPLTKDQVLLEEIRDLLKSQAPAGRPVGSP